MSRANRSDVSPNLSDVSPMEWSDVRGLMNRMPESDANAGELQVGDRVQADFIVDGELEESEGVVRGRQGREYSVRFDDASEWTIGRDKLRRARSQRSTKKDDGEGGGAREDRIEEEEEEEEEEDDDEGLWGQKVYPCR